MSERYRDGVYLFVGGTANGEIRHLKAPLHTVVVYVPGLIASKADQVYEKRQYRVCKGGNDTQELVWYQHCVTAEDEKSLAKLEYIIEEYLKVENLSNEPMASIKNVVYGNFPRVFPNRPRPLWLNKPATNAFY